MHIFWPNNNSQVNLHRSRNRMHKHHGNRLLTCPRFTNRPLPHKQIITVTACPITNNINSDNNSNSESASTACQLAPRLGCRLFLAARATRTGIPSPGIWRCPDPCNITAHQSNPWPSTTNAPRRLRSGNWWIGILAPASLSTSSHDRRRVTSTVATPFLPRSRRRRREREHPCQRQLQRQRQRHPRR